jgi:protein-S-isoprenylcysteine O-methyltransferase Ste14
MANNLTPDRANVIAFPPLLFGGTLVVGVLLRFLFPTPLLPNQTALLIGAAVVLIGLPILLLAFRQMIRNKTTIHPAGTTTTIVSNGLYAYTRNPMYLALTLLYIGVSIMTNAYWGLLLLVPLLILVQKGIIEREEHYLTQKFGEEYIRYRSRVRRWL